MKKELLIFILFFVSLISYSQVIVNQKLELSYEYAELYLDTTHIATIKTHINVDFINNGYFLYLNCVSDRIYHYLYSESCGYDINRLSFTVTDISYVYKNDFKLFIDSIAVEISNKQIRFFKKDYKSIILHN